MPVASGDHGIPISQGGSISLIVQTSIPSNKLSQAGTCSIDECFPDERRGEATEIWHGARRRHRRR